ncbi:hypothetical protein [uncultured Micrococcus sp.]|uniref:hypothetical protein n=1 Tax=uncultured Micrococcus sp. TaxID=114051 RepID=UPI002628CC79|nr:hypothetical protein [uncultured Micrococcus sp.]
MGILSGLINGLGGTQRRPIRGRTLSPFGTGTTRGRSGVNPMLGMLGGLALNQLARRSGRRGYGTARRGSTLGGGLLGAGLGSLLGGRRR